MPRKMDPLYDSFGTLKPYSYSPREKLAEALMAVGGEQKKNDIMGMVDYSPVGAALGAYDAGTDIGAGNLAAGGLGLAMSVGVPGPGKKLTKKLGRIGGKEVRTVPSGMNSEDFELRPELHKPYRAPAMLWHGRVIEGSPGENHALIAEKFGFPKEMIPGFVTHDGEFHYQYSEDLPKK